VSVLLRFQFAEKPDTKTLGMILAYAANDPNFEDSDILED
jgi:hypothetical protein